MKKISALLRIFVVLGFVATLLFSPQSTLAAGETYTWNGQNIQVTGGTVGNATIVANPLAGANSFRTNFQFTNPQCSLAISLTVSNDRKTGAMVARALTGLGADGKPTPVCPPALVNQYNGATITIGGNSSACGTETDATRTVRIIIAAPDEKSAPANLTIDISGLKQKAKKEVTDGSAYYETVIVTDPGKYKVCASPVLKKCEDFEKKCQPLVLTYGDSANAQSLDVKVNLAVLAQTGQSCTIPGYTVNLKKNGATVKTIKTSNGEIKASAGELNSLGGLKDVKLTMVGKFAGITDGTYQVCIENDCKDVTKAKGKQVTPNPVSFDITLQDSSQACRNIGDETTPWPTNPPPPSPPCARFVNGECQEVFSAFGNISTTPSDFITKVFSILLSFAGGLALFLIIKAGYIIMTSRGKPEQLQNGRDQLIAAIVGLMFLIFSFVILQVIGTDILKLPQDKNTGGGKDTGTAAVISDVGGPCGRASGAQCANGLTCNITADTSQECRTGRECSGVCER